jgi:ribonuclease HI
MDLGVTRGTARAPTAARSLRDRSTHPIDMVALASRPHFLLYVEASGVNSGVPRWKFVLQAVGSDDQFAAGDVEYEARIGRLELLAVVRGLEALDQPSRVTLVTRSRYVARGIRRELGQWRDRRWRWERFGQLVPIRDHDLWQRIDRALQFHDVACVGWPFSAEPQLSVATESAANPESPTSNAALLIVPRGPAREPARRRSAWRIGQALNTLRDGVLAPFSAILRPAFTRAA